MKKSNSRDRGSRFAKFYQQTIYNEPCRSQKEQEEPKEFNAKNVMEQAIKNAKKNLK